MRAKLPLLRQRYIPPALAPIPRYVVAVLSIILPLIAGLICFFNAALRSAQEGLRRSEINFRSLVTHAPYGVCRCDSAGILLDVNPALVAMLGYETGADLVGRNLANLYSDSQQWFSLADYLRLLEKFQGLPADWLRNDRTIVSVRLSGRALRDERKTIFFELFAE